MIRRLSLAQIFQVVTPSYDASINLLLNSWHEGGAALDPVTLGMSWAMQSQISQPAAAGKSCYAKQVALIVFLAHIG